MPDLDWTWYDTIVLGATAGAEFEAFQVQLGADTTHNIQFTNLPVPGQIPQNETFLLKSIRFIYDFVSALINDTTDWFTFSVYEIRLQDTVKYQGPVAEAVAHSGYGGAYTLAAAANKNAIGLLGNGKMFEKPLLLNGGDFFKVRYKQGVAISASSEIKVCLSGIRTTK